MSLCNLADLFHSVPTELQRDIVRNLEDSREHLVALSTSSRTLNTLTTEVLHAHVEFASNQSAHIIESYLEHAAPKHARFCKTLDVAFSLKPMITSVDDRLRARQFTQILRNTSANHLRSLRVNTAGSDLSDTSEFLCAVARGNGALAGLRSLELRIPAIDDADGVILAQTFNLMAKPTSLPALQHLSLDAYWQVREGDSASQSLFDMLTSRAGTLRSLSLSHIKCVTETITTLLNCLSGGSLRKLQLNEIEGLDLSGCFEALRASNMASLLQELSITIWAPASPEIKLRTTLIPKHALCFNSLRKLHLGLTCCYVRPIAEIAEIDMDLIRLFTSLCMSSPANLQFPALVELQVGEAFNITEMTSASLALLIIQAKQNIAPRLGLITADNIATSSTSSACVVRKLDHSVCSGNQIAARILSLADVQLNFCTACQANTTVASNHAKRDWCQDSAQ